VWAPAVPAYREKEHVWSLIERVLVSVSSSFEPVAAAAQRRIWYPDCWELQADQKQHTMFGTGFLNRFQSGIFHPTQDEAGEAKIWNR
jgi:hypothetical protein